MKYENAFGEIAQTYYKSIFRYCCVKLNDEHSAKDCTQEVFLILYRKIDTLTLSENIRAWLYRTANNVIRNYLRKNKNTVPLDEIEETAEDSNSVDISVDIPFEDIITREEYELLESYYIKGYDIGTISKNLDISKAAAVKRIQRIKAKIKENYM